MGPMTEPPVKARSTRIGDVVMSKLARLLVRAFFRRIDVAGTEHLPPEGPVVLVGNHINGLVDGLVLMAVLDRYPRFLGKATLFRLLPLVPFLHLAGVVRVYRAADGADTTRNEDAFRTSRALLARGGMVALFPEGISHDESRVQPLRTGAARIALGAADEGVPGVVTVAVGLVYDDKARFRSEALVRIGHPRPVEPWLARYRDAPTDTVRALTDELSRQLAAVAPMYESRQDELTYHRVADIVTRTQRPDVDLARRDRLARQLSLAAASGTDGSADLVADLKAKVDRYEQDLAVLGLDDDQVAAGLSGGYRGRVGGSIALTAVSLPIAAFGAVFHAVPYIFVKQVAKRPENEGMKATIKLLGCFSLFVTGYATFGVLVARRKGLLAGLAAAAAAPASGYVTVRFAERVQRAGGLSHASEVLRERQDLVPALLVQRAAVVTAATTLLSRPPVPAASGSPPGAAPPARR
jgi:1-acyl-sn-glycerol-3-phosphate acyltransferase